MAAGARLAEPRPLPGVEQPPAAQLAHNRVRSKPRARVEHVFGHQVQALAAEVIRTIGLQRATAQLLMGNLMYNMRRYRFPVARQA